jgi:hypothetical protein
MTQWIGWLELVAEQAALAVALLVAFAGCRRIARDGLTRGGAAMVAIALVVPVADAWLNLNVMKSVQALQSDKMAAVALHGREPAGGWEKAASSPEARSAMSTDAATVAYLFEGTRAEVLAADGSRVRFVPSPAQAQAREKFVGDEKGAEVSARASWERGIRLFIETAVFMLAGFALGVRARRRA